MLKQKTPDDPPKIAREWWEGLKKRVLTDRLAGLNSRLRAVASSSEESQTILKEILDLKKRLQDIAGLSV
jgi:hypothetical protein